jgi:hypothetical protein
VTPTEAVAATAAYRRRILSLRLTGAAALLGIWQSLDSARETEVEPFTLRATPVLSALQSTAVALAVGHATLLTGRLTPDLSGLVVEQDLRDPFIGVWRDLSRGTDLQTAIETGAQRVRSLADERVIRSQRAAATRVDADGRIVGWRRVPQGSTCSFCVRAATRRYHSAEAAGNVGHVNHGRQFCDCDVVPIVGDSDPGQVINRPMLDAWHQAQGQEPPAYFDADDLTAAPRP